MRRGARRVTDVKVGATRVTDWLIATVWMGTELLSREPAAINSNRPIPSIASPARNVFQRGGRRTS